MSDDCYLVGIYYIIVLSSLENDLREFWFYIGSLDEKMIGYFVKAYAHKKSIYK